MFLSVVLTVGLGGSGHAAPANAGYFMPRRALPPTGDVTTGTRALIPPGNPGASVVIDNVAFPAITPQEIAAFGRKSIDRIGPFDVESRHDSPLMEEKGVTTTLAYPVKAVPGLDLVASLFGGHRDTRLGAAAGSAAVTGGIRFRW